MNKSVTNIAKILAEDFSENFVDKMRNRVATSHFKYGSAKNSFAREHEPVDAVATALLQIDTYKQTHNLEHLIDAANYLMFAYKFPQGESDYFEGKDSDSSPGVILKSGKHIKHYSKE